MTRSIALLLIAVVPVASAETPSKASPRDPAGLWYATQRFGPEVRGELTLRRQGNGFTAEIAGRTARARAEGDHVSFELPDGEGSFRGRLSGGRIRGHFIQPKTVVAGAEFATPVDLAQGQTAKEGPFRGTVVPLEDEVTFYLPVERDGSGVLHAFLENPERNLGRFLDVDRFSIDGEVVKLTAKDGSAIAEGRYDADADSLAIPLAGLGTFGFHRASASERAGFLPRKTRRYEYRVPPAEDDGWPVGTLEEAGLSREAIEQFVQMVIDTPMDSVHAQQVHGVLIARNGKLVLEEYFHHFHRHEPHDTRSAAKSFTSVLAGAAALRGGGLDETTPVFATMEGPAVAARLDPRKRAVKLEHLLTMSSGLDCDDDDAASPGNENTMQGQTAQPDWYRFTLDLGMIRDPGKKSVYCSVNANLAGGVVAQKARQWLPEVFDDLVARPLQMRRYAMNLMPAGQAYMGGGMRVLPRDFLKLAQLMVDGGKWRGRRILSEGWVKKSVTPRYEMAGIQYGYLWWVIDFPYQGRTVRAFFAGGNGGQLAMGIPELKLAIAFLGGNYSDKPGFVAQRVYVPKYLLPAVR